MTEGIEFRKAGPDDIEMLVEMRAEVLRDVFSLPAGYDMSAIRSESRKYYMESLADGSHTACLAYDGHHVAGCGAICFYRVMPSVLNAGGLCAQIMNMYMRPEYRRRGVASRILRILVDEAAARGVERINLETTEAGREVYRRFGFTQQKDEMELVIKNYTQPEQS